MGVDYERTPDAGSADEPDVGSGEFRVPAPAGPAPSIKTVPTERGP